MAKEIMPNIGDSVIERARNEVSSQPLDEAGVPIFLDMVEVRITKSELYALHKTLGEALVDWDVIPAPEGPGTMRLIEMLGEEEVAVVDRGILTLPSNYMASVFKILSFLKTIKAYEMPGSMSEKMYERLEDRFMTASLGYARIKEKERAKELETSIQRPLLESSTK